MDVREGRARLRDMPTRRKVLLCGVSALAVGGVGIAALLSGDEQAALAGVRRSDAVPIGDGFYRADNWILTEADLAALPA